MSRDWKWINAKKISTLCKYPIYRLTTCIWTPSTFWIIWKTCRCRSSPKIPHFLHFSSLSLSPSLCLFLFLCFNVRFDKVCLRRWIRNGFFFQGRSCTIMLHDSSFASSYYSMHLLFQVDCTPAESHYTGKEMICGTKSFGLVTGNCGPS